MSDQLVEELLENAQDVPTGGMGSGHVKALDFLAEVPLQVTVELGRQRLPISKVLDLAVNRLYVH